MRGLEAQASDGGATTPDPKAPRSAGTLRSLAAKLGMWLVAWVAFVAALAMRQSWASAAHAQSVETFTSSERALGAILKKPATGHDLSFLVSSRDASLITKAESLEGKTLAVETREMSINFFPRNVNQLLPENWIESNGGTYESVHFVTITFPEMPIAIAKGIVDAGVVDEPFTTLAIEAGAKVLSARPYQVIAKKPVSSCWFASTRWVKDHMPAARAFVAALNQSDRYIAKHPTYVRRILPTFTRIFATLAETITMPIFST